MEKAEPDGRLERLNKAGTSRFLASGKKWRGSKFGA